MPELIIGDRRITNEGDCYVIAEIGHNHQGSLETALEMVKVAHECGCDAVKFQKRTIDKCFTKAFLATPYNSEHAYGATYGEHRRALEFGQAEYEELRTYCTRLDIGFIATAFDEDAADFLVSVDVDAIKIASGDLINTPLLQHCAGLGKPLIVSTGGSTMGAVIRADRAIGDVPAAFLHCVCLYPMPAEKANLAAIFELKSNLPHRTIGYSCHENGILCAELAFACWDARIVEKHFTLDHTWKGSDQAMSLQPGGMRRLVRNLRRAKDIHGIGQKEIDRQELVALAKMGKALWPARTLEPGHVIREGDVVAKTPMVKGGLAPYRLDGLLGRELVSGCSTAEAITPEMVGEDDEPI